MADAENLYTCLTCSVAFHSPAEQRDHFRSDLHRYNMKRRVAELGPVSAALFESKVAERRAALDAQTSDPASAGHCQVCHKSFSSANAYRDHLQSKKHRENLQKAPRPSTSKAPLDMQDVRAGLPDESDEDDADLDEEARMERAIEKKIARARRIDPAAECMFCGQAQTSLDTSLAHMSHAHGFFVPERKYLTDLDGFIRYLADKIAVGNVCLWCNGKGRGFHNTGAVQAHMVDKSHCKVAYDTQEDQLEYADFFDFRSSYPDFGKKTSEWEDVSDAEDDDSAEWDSDEDESVPANAIRYGDSELELVLPSGARLGHRSLQRYYRQSLWQTPAAQAQDASATSGRALAHRLAGTDRMVSSDLVVGDRHGKEVVARNRGEAREATRHVREFRDQNRREQFRTKVGYRNNNQKHFRDPLLQ